MLCLVVRSKLVVGKGHRMCNDKSFVELFPIRFRVVCFGSSDLKRSRKKKTSGCSRLSRIDSTDQKQNTENILCISDMTLMAFHKKKMNRSISVLVVLLLRISLISVINPCLGFVAGPVSVHSWSSHDDCFVNEKPNTILCKMIGTGFTFEDGEQILISVQKPMGLVLEQEEKEDGGSPIVVTEIDPSGAAGRAGVQVGDVLLAVQNTSVESIDLENVLGLIANGPRVINLRLSRKK